MAEFAVKSSRQSASRIEMPIQNRIARLRHRYQSGPAFIPPGFGENPETRVKWVSLIRTYFQLGGAQIQPTVASADILRSAQREPENYKDLIVKVGGYSTYFADLGLEIQEEIIARTEHC